MSIASIIIVIVSRLVLGGDGITPAAGSSNLTARVLVPDVVSLYLLKPIPREGAPALKRRSQDVGGKIDVDSTLHRGGSGSSSGGGSDHLRNLKCNRGRRELFGCCPPKSLGLTLSSSRCSGDAFGSSGPTISTDAFPAY